MTPKQFIRPIDLLADARDKLPSSMVITWMMPMKISWYSYDDDDITIPLQCPRYGHLEYCHLFRVL